MIAFCIALSLQKSLSKKYSYNQPATVGNQYHICYLLTGTVVAGNLWCTSHNEALYEDPYSFKANRFLDEEGKFKKPEGKEFTPFGTGNEL